MPCYDSRDDEDRVNTQKRADRATKAACEMARVLQNSDTAWRLVWPRLTLTTQKWIRAHEEVDRKRSK